MRKEVFENGHVAVAANRHVLDGDHVPHYHDFMEIAVVLSGRGNHRTIHGEQEIRSGDVFVLPPGAWHAYVGCRRLDVYNCCFGADLLQRELAWTHDEPSLNYLLQRGSRAPGQREILRLHLPEERLRGCQQHLRAMSGTAGRPSPGGGVHRIGHLLLLFGELAESLGPDHRVPRTISEVHPVLIRGLKMIEENLAHPWSLTELSAALSVDPSYLSRLCKDHTGLPPMKYLARHRTETSATLLLRTDLPVARIGEEVGWPDPNYFARRFKNHFGVSPTAYRAQFTSPESLTTS